MFMPDNASAGLDGTTSDAINVAWSFSRAGVASLFVFNGPDEIFRKFEETGANVRRMEMPIPGLKQHLNPFYRRRFSRQLVEFIEREGIDVIHLGHGGLFVLNYLKSSAVLKVSVQQGATPEFKPIGMFDGGFTLHPKKLLKAWYRKYVRLNYKRSDLVICIGEAAREAALRSFHVAPEKAIVVRPGIEGREAKALQGEIRSELGIEPHEKVILSVGRITRAKGVEDLGNVARMLCERGRKYRFIFVGHERDHAYGKKIRAEFGRYVTFLGHRVDIANLYAGADLLAHLSHREGLGLVVIEALEFGVPCVAWDIPGVSEAVEDGVTGCTIRFGDLEGAADAIENLFENPATLEALKSGARKRFTRYSINDYAGRILAAYEARLRVIEN